MLCPTSGQGILLYLSIAANRFLFLTKNAIKYKLNKNRIYKYNFLLIL